MPAQEQEDGTSVQRFVTRNPKLNKILEKKARKKRKLEENPLDNDDLLADDVNPSHLQESSQQNP